jgi:hypothetical protein
VKTPGAANGGFIEVGLVVGSFADVPGAPQAASSRPGWLCKSWAYPFHVLPAASSWLNNVAVSCG